MNKNLQITIFVCVLGNLTLAQPKDTLKLKQTIGKNYIPSIANSDKISEQPSTISIKVEKKEIPASTLNKHMIFGIETKPIIPARMKGEPLTKLYRSCLKLGAGNYSTTYGELFINNNRSRKQSIGLHMKHLSSQGQLKDVGYSGFSENNIDLYGKKFLRKYLLSAKLDADRNVIHYYGYNPEQYEFLNKNNIRQRFIGYGAEAGWQSFYKDSTKLNHKANVDFHHMNDLYSAIENNIVAKGDITRYISSELFSLIGKIDFNHYKSEMGITDNTLIKLNPQIISKGERWQLKAGLGLYADAGNDITFHFYPDAIFKYNVVENLIIPYLGISGKTYRNNFSCLSTENPFINSEISLLNSNEKYNIHGGIRGEMGSDLSFHLFASKKLINNMPLFEQDLSSILKNKYRVIYDKVALLNVGVEFDYRKLEKLDILLKGEYFSYNMTNELRPWYLPSYQATLIGSYNLRNKILIRAEVVGLSGRWARVNSEEGDDLGYGVFAAKLKGIIDLNIETEYRYNKKLSAFIRLNNIANTRYYQWSNYPSQRFNMLGGISYSFWAK